jgi:hypothetical protein
VFDTALRVIATTLLLCTASGRGGCDESHKQMSEEAELPYATLQARSKEELAISTGTFERLFQIGEADWALDQQRKITELTTPKMEMTEDKAWELAALTCKLGNHQGAYRGPAGPTMVFITFGEVKMQKGR